MLSKLTLARRVETAEALVGLTYAQALRVLGATETVGCIAVAGGHAVFAGIDSPLSRAVGLGMKGPVPESEIDRLEKFYAGHACDVVIDLCPFSDSGLLAILQRRQYVLTEFNHVLARPLTATEIPPQLQTVEVRRARSEESRAWASWMLRGFFGDKQSPGGLLRTAEMLFHTPGGYAFWGLLEGERAATAAMIITDTGVAAFFGDCTIEVKRRKGIQSALIGHRLQEAAARGCDLAMASALPGSPSHRNYERAGFQNLYTRAILRRFLKPPPSLPHRVG